MSELRTRTRTWWTCEVCGHYGDFTVAHPDTAAFELSLIERKHDHPAAPAGAGQPTTQP